MITRNKYAIAINRQSMYATKVFATETILFNLFKKNFTTISDSPEIINRYFSL